ncbi:PucR family transcriptional regulator [Streptomyces aidingensis]|uniref:PucR C-terminal helix-turn-helix domain-containing protein n=1 Tax=Streptomyces aidingensis TaxID=910347 RepID=A0A1I1JDU6_9ACTN|nr:helix-turn-helix domain-containing protein [Streptomyces aidingensis]SFC43620.1 PucR C-terminal helix-turn-helix domain-containing protein [Streptomyces aidingensis]
MKGLLLRLSSIDADAAAAVRVIAHFQALLDGRVTPAALVRSTAGLAECPAGLELADGRTFRCGPDGVALSGPAERVSGRVPLRPAGHVWLERPGAERPLDELVLEWLAIAARTMEQPSMVADPALVELALSRREAMADRARALRLLGLAPELPLRVVVMTDEVHEPDVAALALLGRSAVPGTVRVARVGTLGVALVQHGTAAASPVAELRAVARESVRVGVGAATGGLRAHVSWEQARVALRFTTAGLPDDAVAGHDELGAVTLLAEIPPARLRRLPDAVALAGLAAAEGGRLQLAALAAFCRTGSLRLAAAELHLHHSSVAARLSHVEKAMGLRLRDPGDRFRAQLALYARRLAAAGESGEGGGLSGDAGEWGDSWDLRGSGGIPGPGAAQAPAVFGRPGDGDTSAGPDAAARARSAPDAAAGDAVGGGPGIRTPVGRSGRAGGELVGRAPDAADERRTGAPGSGAEDAEHEPPADRLPGPPGDDGKRDDGTDDGRDGTGARPPGTAAPHARPAPGPGSGTASAAATAATAGRTGLTSPAPGGAR